MGKSKKKKNKRMYNINPASMGSARAAHSTNNAREVKTDGTDFTKGDIRSTDNIQTAGHFPQNMTEEKKDKCSYRSTDNTRAVQQSSLTQASDIIDEEIRELADKMVECLVVLQRYEDTKNSIPEGLRQFDRQNECAFYSLYSKFNELLVDRDCKFIERISDYMTYNLELSYLKKYPISAEETVTAENDEAYQEIKESKEQDDANAKVAMATAKLEYGPNEVSLDMETAAATTLTKAEIHEETTDSKELEDDANEPVTTTADKLKGDPNELQNVEEKKDTDDSGRFADDREKASHCPQNVQGKTEANKDKDKRDNFSPEKETATTISKDKIDECKRVAKERVNQVNYLIQALGKVEKEKKDGDKSINDIQRAHSTVNGAEGKKGTKDFNKSTGYIQTTELFPRNVTESRTQGEGRTNDDNGSTGHIQTSVHFSKNVTDGKKEANKVTEDINKSTVDNKVEGDSSINKKLDFDTDTLKLVEESVKQEKPLLEKRQPENMAKKISPQNNKMEAKSAEVFRHDLKEFLALQNSKLDEQMKARSVVKSGSKILKEQRDILSSEKEIVKSPVEAQYEIGIKPEAEDDTVKDVSTTAEQFQEPYKGIKRLDDTNGNIRFEFKTNGNKCIKAGNKNLWYSPEQKPSVKFDFHDGKVQVSFIDDKVIVSTPDGGYDIYFRKRQPVDLKDDTTQTNAKL